LCNARAATNATAGGVLLDHGGLYASAALSDLSRMLLFGWVTNGYDLAHADSPQFDNSLSLPRVMKLITTHKGQVMPAWEIAPEIAGLRAAKAVVMGITVPPYTAVPLALPPGTTGDALEIRLNATHGASVAFAPLGVSVRATRGLLSNESEQTLIYFGNGTGLEVHGTSRDPHAYSQDVVAPPYDGFASDPSYVHSLRVFIDKSVIEAHLDQRLSATVRAYPSSKAATHAFVINRGERPVRVDSIELWGMMPIFQGVGFREEL
jgi:sucrose-6-phosphate hydrolase SacC (GH32 family)